jgi:hypothetical protein
VDHRQRVGQNARINHNSVDHSTNVVAESGAVHEHLAALREAIANLGVAKGRSGS